MKDATIASRTSALLLAGLSLAACATTTQELTPALMTMRQGLAVVDPIRLETVRRIEFQRGATFTDAELAAVITSDSFAGALRTVQAEFCAQKRNAQVLVCARNTDS
jgi:hypothetical protein